MNAAWNTFIIDYPFLRLDKYIAFDLPTEAHIEADNCFKKIFEEYHSDNKDKFQFIQTYTQFLLNLTNRFFEKLNVDIRTIENNRSADILLVSRFQTLIETQLSNEEANSEIRHASFYADRLNIHPNYFNAVVKRITGANGNKYYSATTFQPKTKFTLDRRNAV